MAHLAEGLSFWVMGYGDMGEMNKNGLKEIPSFEEVVKILEELYQMEEVKNSRPKTPKRIFERIRELLKNQVLVEKLRSLDLNVQDTEENVQKLLDTCFRLYFSVGCDSFFVLHAVTSSRALKTVLRYLRSHNQQVEDLGAINCLWRALLIVLIVLETPPVDEHKSILPLREDWDSIVQTLLKQDRDAHIVKIIYVAREEEEERRERNGQNTWIDDQNFYINVAKEALGVEKFVR